MVSMLSGSDDGSGEGLSCPEKDRCTNYSCAGGFLRVFKGVDVVSMTGSITQKTALNIILAAVRT
jgi:hypothetical protein